MAGAHTNRAPAFFLLKKGNFVRNAATLLATLLLVSVPSAAAASDNVAELWLNPSVAIDLDDDTGLELETAQRFRSAADGPDTFFYRFWLNQNVGDGLTLSGAVERRINTGDDHETRTMQQLSLSKGMLRSRLRLEQRFVDDADRMGLRLRARLGIKVPLADDGEWSFGADAEPFITLRSTSAGGEDGLTGLRTQLTIAHEISDKLTISAGYLRQQDIRRGAPDRIGHAPILGLELSF